MAWLGFTFPSAVALILFAYGVRAFDGEAGEWLHGLKIAAVAVVALALWGMGKTLAPDRPRIAIAVLATVCRARRPSGIAAQLAVIAGGAVLGLVLLRAPEVQAGSESAERGKGTIVAVAALTAFFALLLVALPVVSRLADGPIPAMVDSFYRSGSLVFGGGHVVLPLLEVPRSCRPGWVAKDEFIAGYGAAQAVPGPLFTFSSYLGTVMEATNAALGRGAWSPSRPYSRRPSCWSSGCCRSGSCLRGFRRVQTGADGRESGSRGAAAGRAVRPGVDQRDRRARGLRTGGRGVRTSRLLEGAAVARRPTDRRRRCARRAALAPLAANPSLAVSGASQLRCDRRLYYAGVTAQARLGGKK